MSTMAEQARLTQSGSGIVVYAVDCAELGAPLVIAPKLARQEL
jgi:hypothetical protein